MDASPKTRLIDLIQVLTTIAMVIGLGLVIYESRQSRELAQLEALNQGIATRNQHVVAALGENPSDVWVKGCLSPEELTQSEVAILYNDIGIFFLMTERIVMMQALGYGRDFDQFYARSYIARYLGYRLGRADYDLYGDTWPPEIRALAADIVASDDVVDCRSWFEPLYEQATKVVE